MLLIQPKEPGKRRSVGGPGKMSNVRIWHACDISVAAFTLIKLPFSSGPRKRATETETATEREVGMHWAKCQLKVAIN